jgi:hypothetical protein
MPATVIERGMQTVKIQIEIPLSGLSMLKSEEAIQAALNEAGTLASTEALKQFDTDGAPIDIGSTRYTSKGQQPKTYQTPYGEAVVDRHVYQSPQGGTTFCPLEQRARIILTATPFFAKQISGKYAEMAGGRVVRDLRTNHGRSVSLCLVQDIAAVVGSIAQAKEEHWQYATPQLDKPIATVSIGLDGTCLLLLEDGGRQAMVGTISLYDKEGERQHTIYLAAAPQYGKESFYQRLDREIKHTRKMYPRAHVTGVADGAGDNWTFLGKYTKDECIDFWHAAEYLSDAATAAHPRNKKKQQQWLEDRRHRLRHEKGGADRVFDEMRSVKTSGLTSTAKENLEAAITYFSNHKHQMKYAQRAAAGLPIGSGVTESACKTLVKMRMCRSGAKWTEEGAGIVLTLRALSYTNGRWDQFWDKLDQHGFPIRL